MGRHKGPPCAYGQGCPRSGAYFMGWRVQVTLYKAEQRWGLVCATHDRMLGIANLQRAYGLSVSEAASENYRISMEKEA